METSASVPASDELVPDEIIPHRSLPPLRYRDLPEAPHWTKLVGPSVMLAGLALGSGEFIFWPYLTYKSGFVFFWACMLGVITQFFINMEIERWTLVTGETAVTGFSRLSPHWAWVMLILNTVPWIWPGWATGAGTLACWLILGPVPVPIDVRHPMPPSAGTLAIPAELSDKIRVEGQDMGSMFVWSGPMSYKQRVGLAALSPDRSYQRAVRVLEAKVGLIGGLRYETPLAPYFAIGSLLFIGVVLTTGPVIYNTVERLQFWLVSLIFVIAFVLGVQIIRLDAVEAMIRGAVSFGDMPPDDTGIEMMALLGAVAFAGAGGTMNLGQSNFIRDKGYGMGKYVGRITSPLTGQAEAVADVGFHFPHTPENLKKFKAWWKAANYEHFFTFYLTCVVCLMLLALISYSLFYLPGGKLRPGLPNFGTGMNFVWGEATSIYGLYSNPWVGSFFRALFLIMGISLLLTTELGVLDASARISADIIKVNYLRNNANWSQSRLYFLFLWGSILSSIGILVAGLRYENFREPLFLLKTSAAMNGGVMLIYTILLLYLNTKILSRSLAVSAFRFTAMMWACAFFGYFTCMALRMEVIPYLQKFLLWFEN